MSAPRTPLDRLRSKKKPFTQRVPLCCDVEAAEALDVAKATREEIRGRVDRMKFLDQTPNDELRRMLEDAEARVEECERAVEEATEIFVFRGVKRDIVNDLLDEHRPTKAEIETNKAKGLPAPEWNQDTFPAALCATTCVSHADLTHDDWKVLWHDAEEWNSAELSSMFSAAYAANVQMRVVEMGKGSAGTRS